MRTSIKHHLFVVMSMVLSLPGLVSASRPGDFGNQWVMGQRDLTIYTWPTILVADPSYAAVGANAVLTPSGGVAQAASDIGLPWHGITSIIDGTAENTIDSLLSAAEGSAGFLLRDEPPHSDFVRVGELVTYIKQHYPNLLVYTNLWNSAAGADALWGDSSNPSYTGSQYIDDAMQLIQPDILMHTCYPFRTGGLVSWYYEDLMLYREKGLQYNVPNFVFVQSYDDGGSVPLPSESELRMQLFSSLTAGYKGFNYFVFYESSFVSGLIRTADYGFSSLYAPAAQANKEVKALGTILKDLTSTDVRFVPGATNSTPHATPSGLSNWQAGVGDVRITDVQVLDDGPGKDGMIGFFSDSAGGSYFMLTNLYQSHTLDAAQSAVTFEITFAEGTDAVLRYSRLTGQKGLLLLDGDNTLTVTLPGGTGDLLQLDAYYAQTTIAPSDWGIVNSDNPETSYPQVANTYVGRLDSDAVQRVFLKYDVPDFIRSDADILLTEFSLAASNPLGDPGVYATLSYIQDDAWDSGTLTWDNQPQALFDEYPLYVKSDWDVYDPNDLRGLFTEGGGEAVSLRLKAYYEGSTPWYVFVNPADTATLTIYYVPRFAGDVNADFWVDLRDLAVFSREW